MRIVGVCKREKTKAAEAAATAEWAPVVWKGPWPPPAKEWWERLSAAVVCIALPVGVPRPFRSHLCRAHQQVSPTLAARLFSPSPPGMPNLFLLSRRRSADGDALKYFIYCFAKSYTGDWVRILIAAHVLTGFGRNKKSLRLGRIVCK